MLHSCSSFMQLCFSTAPVRPTQMLGLVLGHVAEED